MSDGTTHDMLDEVAVYALGAMPAAQAARVRDHIAACEECAREYALLQPVVGAVAAAGPAATPSPLLKARVMRSVRAETRTPRPPVWPAYLVAAACFAIAIVSSVWNVALIGQLKQTQSELARVSDKSTTLARNLADERATVSDLVGAQGKHYPAGDDEVVTHGSRLYVAMRSLPDPPKGKVYQAWTLAKGAKKMSPSLTFVPDSHGVAVISLPADAQNTAAVAVSVEPEGGSKQPTSKPVLLVPLT